MARGRKKKSGPPFVQLFHWMLASAAWQDLSLGARATYVELKRHYNGKNNGSIGMGSRGAGAAVGKSKSTAARYLIELEAHGFIKRSKPSSFHQKRLAIEWCLTEFRDDSTGELASKLFASWTREHGLKRNAGAPRPAVDRRTVASTRRDDLGGVPGAKNQKPVPSMAPIVPAAGPFPNLVSVKGRVGPNSGTAPKDLSALQSHGRDTSTSVPEGTSEYILELAASIRIYLRTAYRLESSEDDWWLIPLTAAVASRAQHDGKRDDVLIDPMLSAILSTFPGAATSWGVHPLPGYLEGVASDGLLLN